MRCEEREKGEYLKVKAGGPGAKALISDHTIATSDQAVTPEHCRPWITHWVLLMERWSERDCEEEDSVKKKKKKELSQNCQESLPWLKRYVTWETAT